MRLAGPLHINLPTWATDAFFELECQRVASEVQRFFEKYSSPTDHDHIDLNDHISRIRERKYKFIVDTLHDGSAFLASVKSRTVKFNLQGLLLICRSVCDDASLPENERLILTRNAIALFIFHELRHISQELENYASIQQLKDINQHDLIAQFDLLADLSAAKDFASFRNWKREDNHFSDWSDSFIEAMFLHVFYCIPAFNYPMSSSWKMGRAIGMIMTLARATVIKENLEELAHIYRSISVGLLVRPSNTYDSASVLWVDKQLALAAIILKPNGNWLFRVAKSVEEKNMEKALEISTAYITTEESFWAKWNISR